LAFTDDVTGLKERRDKKKNPVDENDAKKSTKKGKKWYKNNITNLLIVITFFNLIKDNLYNEMFNLFILWS